MLGRKKHSDWLKIIMGLGTRQSECKISVYATVKFVYDILCRTKNSYQCLI